MGITAETFPQAKKIYKKLFKSKSLNNFIHKCLNFSVDCWSSARGFYFPEKFLWDWKLEMLLEKYEPDTVALFKKIIKPGMTVLDIGANIGYYTRLFAKLAGPAGRVLSFEPEFENFQLLQKNTANLKSVKLFNLAISDQNGEIAFYKVKNSTGCHSVIPQQQAETIRVKAVSLDAFLAGQKIKQIDIIKIDIEGGEPLAFRGMEKLFLETRSLSVVMEFFPEALKSANVNPLEFLQNIKNYGFNILQIFPNAKTEVLPLENIKNLEWHRPGYVNLLLKK